MKEKAREESLALTLTFLKTIQKIRRISQGSNRKTREVVSWKPREESISRKRLWLMA